jgi:seryl-tRNA synthetase
MLDPRRIRDHYDEVKAGLLARRFPIDILDSFITLDQEWRDVLQRVEQLQAKRNQLTPKGKPTADQLSELKCLSDEFKLAQDNLSIIEARVNKMTLEFPNIPHASVPIGTSEADNVEVRRVGDIPSFSFTPKPHDELGLNLGILDFESAAKITGSRFAIYRNLGAKLERALISFMLDLHTQEHGYSEIMPPVLINSASLTATGQLPKFSEDSFRIADSDYWLSPTAEVQITNLYRDEILSEDQLPLYHTAYTPCFRREAGSYGRDMTGLIRLHQFNKVELVKFVKPEHSMAELDTLLANAERVLQLLELPYRVVSLCSGDIGFSSAKTYDIEVWFPSQNTYREISSCSNFLDFQARRGMIRYKDTASKKNIYVHTLNGSGLAIGRTFAALLENFQQSDGHIQLPKALVPYMGIGEIS